MKTKVTELNRRADRLAELADQSERQAKMWIDTNPHVALAYALAAHVNWHGCQCELEDITDRCVTVVNNQQS